MTLGQIYNRAIRVLFESYPRTDFSFRLERSTEKTTPTVSWIYGSTDAAKSTQASTEVGKAIVDIYMAGYNDGTYDRLAKDQADTEWYAENEWRQMSLFL
jgi:hypothetical protein